MTAHALSGKTEDGDRRDEQDQIVELPLLLDMTDVGWNEYQAEGSSTAVREYSFSSTSVRASTKRRRKLGRLAWRWY